jgi:SAM-dependent methyltransferase
MIKKLKYIFKKIFKLDEQIIKRLISQYLKNGSIPWSKGYNEFKVLSIDKEINNPISFNENKIIKGYGRGVDERIIEYPWVISNLNKSKLKLLDAGSVFNYDFILKHPTISEKELFIQTYYPENNCFYKKRISYVYEDLRNIPFKNNFFDEVVCISTIEHIDMDNSIYGYSLPVNNTKLKSYDYLNVINELVRVLKKNGILLLTFPFGKFENHGFFQQFDIEMVKRITELLQLEGKNEIIFFKYLKHGWILSNENDCSDCESYNPHTGVGKKDDNAAHSRAICCIKFIKI